jgi:hypothetical protein
VEVGGHVQGVHSELASVSLRIGIIAADKKDESNVIMS